VITKHRIVGRAGVLVAALAGLSLALNVPASAEETPAYSHNSTIGLTAPSWMARLSDSTPLSQLSLPGTHDSGASVFGGDIAFTQSMSLATQLDSGIRVWDIRLAKDANGRLVIFHGIAEQGQDWENNVLATVAGFLRVHPTETVLMRVKDENGSTSGFAAAVQAGLDKYIANVYTGASNDPTMKDIRGKIVVLQDFAAPTRVGIPWNSLNIQDNYNLSNNWDLANKWHAVQRQLAAAAAGPRTTTYVNFLSGSGGSFPYFVASGHSSPGTGAPQLLTGWTRGVINTCGGSSQCIPEYPSVNCFLGTCSVAFIGTNLMTMNTINNRAMPNRYGIVYADFPGAGLVSAVIAANF
jgi:1-phosphatidylinositol phosphodiesterase